MKNLTLSLLLLFLPVLATAVALSPSSSAEAQSGPLQDAVNELCPIGAEPIDGETFVVYEGHRIGFCCGGCDSKFLAWSKEDRDAFVLKSLSQDGDDPVVESKPKEMELEPYTLSACPVSGEPLGSMGDQVEVTVEGRLVKLCCSGCKKKLVGAPDKYLAIVDAAFAEQQRPYYMLETCVVSGEPLFEDGEDVGLDVVVKHRLFRVCCKSCVKKLRKDPSKYLDVLNRKIVEAQRPLYPLEHCLVRGEEGELGSMGVPYELVTGNRLVRFCCKGCAPKFHDDPAKFIDRLDTAWEPVFARLAKERADKAKVGAEHGKEHGGHEGDHR